MESSYKIAFLLITLYDTKEIRSIYLKEYDFNLETKAPYISLQNTYKRLYIKTVHKGNELELITDIIKILTKEKYSSVFLEDNNSKLKEILKSVDLIIGYDIKKNFSELNFEENFEIFDIKDVFEIKFEDILKELEINNIFMDNQILDTLFKFTIKRLKETDDILMNKFSEMREINESREA